MEIWPVLLLLTAGSWGMTSSDVLRRPVSLPRLTVEGFVTALAVIAVVWVAWVALWLVEHRW